MMQQSGTDGEQLQDEEGHRDLRQTKENSWACV